MRSRSAPVRRTLDELLNVDRAKLQAHVGDVFAKRLPGGDSALLDAIETVKVSLLSVTVLVSQPGSRSPAQS